MPIDFICLLLFSKYNGVKMEPTPKFFSLNWTPILNEFVCPRQCAGTYSVTHVRNSEIKQLLTLFFAMLWDIDLIFGMWVYSDKLQIEFTFCYGPIICGRVMAFGLLKFGQIFSCHHFFSLCLEILTWFLVWECIIISYRSTLKFIQVEWFLASLQALGFEIWPNI